MSGGEARQHRTRACHEQRDAKELPCRKRARLSDDDAAGRLLPATGGHLPAELLLGQETQRGGGGEHAFDIVERARKV